LVNEYGCEFQSTKKFCEYIGISEGRFWEVVDSFTDKNVFKTDGNNKSLWENEERLIKKYTLSL